MMGWAWGEGRRAEPRAPRWELAVHLLLPHTRVYSHLLSPQKTLRGTFLRASGEGGGGSPFIEF